MPSHNSSAFIHSCLKVPRNVKIDQPLPLYEQNFIHHFENEVKKLGMNSENIGIAKKKFVDKKGSQSFINFISNIPEYNDINHLSNKEFYKKLDNLKEKQKLFQEYLQNDIKFDPKDTEWIEAYKDMKMGVKNLKDTKKKNLRPFCATPVLNNPCNLLKTPEIETDVVSDKDTIIKPPSRRSVRIETPSEKLFSNLTPEPRLKSKANSIKDRKMDEWNDMRIERLNLDSVTRSPIFLETKSAPCSPTRSRSNVIWNDGGVTIPKPFQMTVRDEENKIVDELYIKMKKPNEPKSDQFRAHDVPIESQIPLFDRIMADQERRSFLSKQKRKAALQSQMKPFSFTRRDEEIQELTKELSKSTPDLFTDPPLKIKRFKAKPIPKNLFSNYIYRKMHEDEFYRALQKKIRAEELMKASSLPPSMAKRERSKSKFDVCPRLYKDGEIKSKIPKSKKSSPFQIYQDRLEKELEELKNEYIGIDPIKMKTKFSKKGEKEGRRNYRYSSASSKSSSSKSPSYASYDLSSINRSNLAAVLRIQSARKKLEKEMMQKLEEAKLKEEARWREKIMRKKPVWQSLTFSHEEDLAMRLQLRRDEERLRKEEHQLRMQLMLGRVYQQPTLFERQSQFKCPKTRDELVNQMYLEYDLKKKRREDPK